MTAAGLVQGRIWESWNYYQGELVRVIEPLTEEQMALRLVPELRSVGELAEHVVRARALWLPVAFGQGNAELEPMANWDEPDDPPRTAAEVVQGLEQTWQILTACLARWPADASRETISDEEVAQLRTVWGLMEHDLHHGGELAFVLGAFGLPAPEM